MERKSFVSKLFWDACVMAELWESVPKGSTEHKALCVMKRKLLRAGRTAG